MIQFQRKTKIFRGEFLAGPFAAVFLLFLVFFSFTTSIVYLPGLPAKLGDSSNPRINALQTGALVLDAPEVYRFKGEEFKDLEAFGKRLSAEKATNTYFKWLIIETHPAVTNEVVSRVVDLAKELKLEVDLPGLRIDLPIADSLVIITNPTLTVAINLNGQIYFQSQVVTEERLRPRLIAAVKEYRKTPTLLVLADKAASFGIVAKVGAAARAAGIHEVVLTVKPPVFIPESTP